MYLIILPVAILNLLLSWLVLTLALIALSFYFWYCAFRYEFGFKGGPGKLILAFALMIPLGLVIAGGVWMQRTMSRTVSNLGGAENLKEMTKKREPPKTGDFYVYDIDQISNGATIKARLKVKIKEVTQNESVLLHYELTWNNHAVEVEMKNTSSQSLSLPIGDTTFFDQGEWKNNASNEEESGKNRQITKEILQEFSAAQSDLMVGSALLSRVVVSGTSAVSGEAEALAKKSFHFEKATVAGIKGQKFDFTDKEGKTMYYTSANSYFLPTLDYKSSNKNFGLKLLKFHRD